MIRRTVLAAAAATAGVLTAAAPALAHIAPDPSEAQAGSTLTVGFTVEHGCDESPTVQIEMRLPEGVTDATPEPVDGWDESIDDDIVTFEGGSLPADEPGTFEITMTMPPTPDVTIYFPFVQRCEEGEIRWIALPDDSGDEPDEPAPALDLTGPVVTTTVPDTTVPDTTPATTPETTPETTAPTVDSTPATSEAATATSEAASPETTTPEGDDDGGLNTGTIVFIVSVLAALVIGVIIVMSARRSRSQDLDTDE